MNLASEMHINLAKSKQIGMWMRSLLINKNLSFYYWLRKRIGKKVAFKVANTIEKVILIFGREQG
jgi:hypothetical protein